MSRSARPLLVSALCALGCSAEPVESGPGSDGGSNEDGDGGSDGGAETTKGDGGDGGDGGTDGSSGTTGCATTGGGSGWSSNLPIVVVDTMGQEIVDDPRIVANMEIIDNCAGRNYLEDDPNGYDGRITIEIRGSTSQMYPKKSYGFETQTDAGTNANVSLLGLPPENDWVLYAPYTDKTLVRNVVAYRLWGAMGHYSVRTKLAELFVDAEYQGVYVLIEKIKRDDNRVAITPLLPTAVGGDELTGGYIVKVDKLTGAGDWFWSSRYDDRVKFQPHDPGDVELIPEQRNYIETYVSAFEDTLNGPSFTDPVAGWRSLADEASFIDFMILEELGRAVDGYRSSTFMHKERTGLGGKLTMGPVWDFDVAFGNVDYCDGWPTDGWQYQFNSECPMFDSQVPFWWERLLQDPEFTRALQCRWQELRGGVLDTNAVLKLVDDLAAQLDEAQARNFERWPILGERVDWNYFVGDTYVEEIEYMKTWLVDRLGWLDQSWPGSC